MAYTFSLFTVSVRMSQELSSLVRRTCRNTTLFLRLKNDENDALKFDEANHNARKAAICLIRSL